MTKRGVITVIAGLVTFSAPLFAQQETADVRRAGSAVGRWNDPLSTANIESVAPLCSRVIGSACAEDRCVSLEPVYYGEVISNTRGGISTRNATKYQGLLDLPLTLDLEAARLPLPGKVFLLAQNTHGQGLTQDFVGDSLVLSNIDSGDNIAQVSEYWMELELSERVAIRVGKQDVNTEFLLMEMANDFIQSSFGLSPSVSFPTYPNPSMAALLFVELDQACGFKTGVWDLFADGGGWGFSGNDAFILFAALDWNYELGERRLPGTVEVGAGYDSGGGPAGDLRPTAYGFYAQAEQLVYRENAYQEGDAQGLGIFLSYFPVYPSGNGVIPLDAIGTDLIGGVVYTGLIAGRDYDVIGTGMAWAELFQGGANEEKVVEVFYKARITPRFYLQPDLQYIASPSGIYRDSLVVGLRFQLEL